MAKSVKTTVQFKDPDFVDGLLDNGMADAAGNKVRAKGEFGEYFTLELQFDSTSGQILSARLK